MAILGMMLFSAVFGVSIWSIAVTVVPRWEHIVALLNGSGLVAPQRVPVAALRIVRRMEPVRFRQQPQRVAA